MRQMQPYQKLKPSEPSVEHRIKEANTGFADRLMTNREASYCNNNSRSSNINRSVAKSRIDDSCNKSEGTTEEIIHFNKNNVLINVSCDHIRENTVFDSKMSAKNTNTLNRPNKSDNSNVSNNIIFCHNTNKSKESASEQDEECPYKPFYYTFEYYLYVSLLIAHIIYLFYRVFQSSRDQMYVYRYELAEPKEFLRKYFYAEKYDEELDSQWRGFTRNLPTFVKLFVFLACMTWVIRRWCIPLLERFQKEQEQLQHHTVATTTTTTTTTALKQQRQEEQEEELVELEHVKPYRPTFRQPKLTSAKAITVHDTNSFVPYTRTSAQCSSSCYCCCCWSYRINRKCTNLSFLLREWIMCRKWNECVCETKHICVKVVNAISNYFSITWPLCVLYIVVGFTFMAVVHGPYFVCPLTFMLINYIFAGVMEKHLSLSWYMAIVWVANLLFLYAGMRYSSFNNITWLRPLFMTQVTATYVQSGKVYTSTSWQMRWHQRMRWQGTQGLIMLRLIAYHYDRWEACHSTENAENARRYVLRKHDETCIECAELRYINNNQNSNNNNSSRNSSSIAHQELSCAEEANVTHVTQQEGNHIEINHITNSNVILISPTNKTYSNNNNHLLCPNEHINFSQRCYKFRASYPRSAREYHNILHFGAFMLFTPLYLGGPVSTFNAFTSYLHSPTRSFPPLKMLLYTFRTCVLYALNTVMLHYIYVEALTYSAGVLTSLPLTHQAGVLYFYLAYLWMKFGLIWKSARLFAAWCGIEVPEDMRRCFSDTVSIQEFWRDWHASFNLWIVRYMYIPMGGSRTKFISIFPIFLFIAIWHDLELRLIHWALCVCVAFLLELICTALLSKLVKAIREEMQSINSKGCNKKINIINISSNNIPNGSNKNMIKTLAANDDDNDDDEEAERVRNSKSSNNNKNNNYNNNNNKSVNHHHSSSSSSSNTINYYLNRHSSMLCRLHYPLLKKCRVMYYSVIHWYAKEVLTHFTPPQRRWLFRVLHSCAAGVNAFLLIIANLLGFSVQHTGTSFNAKEKPPSETSQTLAHGLANTSWWLRCGIVVCLYTAASISLMHREAEAHRRQQKRQKYRLVTETYISKNCKIRTKQCNTKRKMAKKKERREAANLSMTHIYNI